MKVLARPLSCCLFLAACTTVQATPAGPLGELDVRDELPEGVTVPDEAQLETHETTMEVCPDEGFGTARVEIVWRTFADGEDRYVADARVALIEPGQNQHIRLHEEPTVGGAYIDPDRPWMGVLQLMLSCHRKGRRGLRAIESSQAELIELLADGSSGFDGEP